MFGNIGWAEFFVLMVAALVVLGPERLPGAAAWVARTLRQGREYATGARDKLKEDLGEDFEDLRKPIAEIAQLRNISPRAAITKHLLDGDDSFFTGKFDSPKAKDAIDPAAAVAAAAGNGQVGAGKDAAGASSSATASDALDADAGPNLSKETSPAPSAEPTTAARTPFDLDAT